MHGPSLPFQGRWLGAAETERSYQICSNLSVSLRLPAPLEGEPRRAHRRKGSDVGDELSVSLWLTASLPLLSLRDISP